MDHVTGNIFRISNIFLLQRVLHRYLYAILNKLESTAGWQLIKKNGPILIFIAALTLFLFIINPNNPLDTLDHDSLYFFSQVIILLLQSCNACLFIGPGRLIRLISTLAVPQYTRSWLWVIILDFAIPPPLDLA